MRIKNIETYLLFSGDYYYPNGGWTDFDSEHDTLEEALKEASRPNGYPVNDWWQIVYKGEIVREGTKSSKVVVT